VLPTALQRGRLVRVAQDQEPWVVHRFDEAGDQRVEQARAVVACQNAAAEQADDSTRLLDPLVTGLIESMQHPRFLILGDPSDAGALRARWDPVDAAAATPR
jgi:hypothetical protein